MQEVKAHLHECAHCGTTGTCKNGKEGRSCAACVKYHELQGLEHIGLACGTCGGLGKGEAYTERLNKRIQPLLARVLVFIAFMVLFAAMLIQSTHFSEILAFISTLVGGVVGFYFSQRHVDTP
jgi:hypothetical protein